MPIPRGCHSIPVFWTTSNSIDGQQSSDLIVMMVNGFFRGTTYRNSWNMLLMVGSNVSQGPPIAWPVFFVAANEKSPF
jgi:hypothetical protein